MAQFTLADGFWKQVDKSGDCWIWTGTQNRNGYGLHRFSDEGRERREVAHRTAWRLSGRFLDPSLTLDHLCRVRLCVRPDHLDQVSARENLLRGDSSCARYARRTHCKRGHPFEPPHLYWRYTSRGTPFRQCRTCNAIERPGWGKGGLTPSEPTETGETDADECICPDDAGAHPECPYHNAGPVEETD